MARRVPERVHGRAFAAYNAARNAAELSAIGAGGLLVTGIGPERGADPRRPAGRWSFGLAGLAALRRPASRAARSAATRDVTGMAAASRSAFSGTPSISPTRS